jgi:hypothetical protein
LHEADDQAADERAGDAAEPAEDDGDEHQHDEVDGDARLDRIVGREQSTGGGHERNAGAEREAVHRAHVDALIAGGLRIIRGRAQRAAGVCAGEKDPHRCREHQGHRERVGARLVQQDRSHGESLRGVRGANAARCGREDHRGGVGDDQRESEREDELRVHLPLRITAAGDAREQPAMDDPAEDEERWNREQRAEQRIDAGQRVEVREVHPEHHEVALREVHDAHDTEDQRQADAHQRIHASDEQSGGDVLGELSDGHR